MKMVKVERRSRGRYIFKVPKFPSSSSSYHHHENFKRKTMKKWRIEEWKRRINELKNEHTESAIYIERKKWEKETIE